MDGWTIFGRIADLIAYISIVISIITLFNTKKIRKSMLVHVESTGYRDEIDEKIDKLETFKSLLVENASLKPEFFLKLIIELQDISIAYETILPAKLLKKINSSIEHIREKMYPHTTWSKKDIETCVSLLGYIINELKKEKKII